MRFNWIIVGFFAKKKERKKEKQCTTYDMEIVCLTIDI